LPFLFSTSLLSTVIIFSAHGLLPTKRSSGVFNCMRIHCCTSSAGHEVKLTCRSVCKATCRSHLRRVSGGLEVFTCAQNVYFCRKNLVVNSRPLKSYRSNGEKHYIRLHPITSDYIQITFRLHSDYSRAPQTQKSFLFFGGGLQRYYCPRQLFNHSAASCNDFLT
jgi:hypothetical protein